MALLALQSSTPDLCVSDYAYVRLLTRSRLAWEYLRRSPAYIRDWRSFASGRPTVVFLTDGTDMFRARRRYVRAEAWGMWCFC